jgi:hypothetical protein
MEVLAMTDKAGGQGDGPTGAKKTDVLQIRIDPDTKAEFIDACERKGTSASQVLRKAILDYVTSCRRQFATGAQGVIAMVPKPVRRKRYLFAGVAASLGLALFAALPSAAEPDYRDRFNRLDLDRDGLLTREEFTGGENAEKYEMWDALNGKPGAKPLSQFAQGNKDLLAILEKLQSESTEQNRKFDELFPPEQRKALQESTRDFDPDLGLGSNLADLLDPRDIRGVTFWANDSNHDGRISYEEFEKKELEHRNRLFAGIDQNDDEFITREDSAISIEKARARGEPEIPGLNQTPDAIWRNKWSPMDANRDNKVSLEEYLAAPKI